MLVPKQCQGDHEHEGMDRQHTTLFSRVCAVQAQLIPGKFVADGAGQEVSKHIDGAVTIVQS